jgi:flagellar protein FlaG
MTIDSIGTAATARSDRSVIGADPAHAAATPRGATPATATASNVTSAAVKGAGATPSQDEVDQAVSNLNKVAQQKAQGIEFSIDPDSKRTIVQVVDQSTKEVLRQFPSKEALAIAKSLDQSASGHGLLIDHTA